MKNILIWSKKTTNAYDDHIWSMVIYLTILSYSDIGIFMISKYFWYQNIWYHFLISDNILNILWLEKALMLVSVLFQDVQRNILIHYSTRLLRNLKLQKIWKWKDSLSPENIRTGQYNSELRFYFLIMLKVYRFRAQEDHWARSHVWEMSMSGSVCHTFEKYMR